MTLDEAIKHCEEKAKELRTEAEQLRDIGEVISSPKQPYNIPVKNCLDCAREHEQLAEWLRQLKYISGSSSYAELTALRKFAEFVSTEVCNDYFNDNADSFAELCCRKLVKLGYVEVVDDKYILRGKGGDEE